MAVVSSHQAHGLSGVVQPVRIGFVPLADCAPLLVADALGMFRRHGVLVKLSCEVGWATVREKLLYRQIDAAHAIAGLALAMRMGISSPASDVIAPFVFNLHGNAITLSRDLWNRGVRDARTLHKLLRSSHGRVLTIGVVSRYSSHAFLVRRWLESGGMTDHEQVRTVVLPPTQMPSCLASGLIDGYCAGEPWNSVAVESGAGWIAATSEQLAQGHVEKVLLTSERFVAEHRDQAAAIIAALCEACAFCDERENRPEVVRLLKASGYFTDCADALSRSLIGPLDLGTGQTADVGSFHVFHRRDSNTPTEQRGQWLLDEFMVQGLLAERHRTDAEAAMRACWQPLPIDRSSPRVSSRPKTRRPKPTPTLVPA